MNSSDTDSYYLIYDFRQYRPIQIAVSISESSPSPPGGKAGRCVNRCKQLTPLGFDLTENAFCVCGQSQAVIMWLTIRSLVIMVLYTANKNAGHVRSVLDRIRPKPSFSQSRRSYCPFTRRPISNTSKPF